MHLHFEKRALIICWPDAHLFIFSHTSNIHFCAYGLTISDDRVIPVHEKVKFLVSTPSLNANISRKF